MQQISRYRIIDLHEYHSLFIINEGKTFIAILIFRFSAGDDIEDWESAAGTEHYNAIAIIKYTYKKERSPANLALEEFIEMQYQDHGLEKKAVVGNRIDDQESCEV